MALIKYLSMVIVCNDCNVVVTKNCINLPSDQWYKLHVKH